VFGVGPETLQQVVQLAMPSSPQHALGRPHPSSRCVRNRGADPTASEAPPGLQQWFDKPGSRREFTLADLRASAPGRHRCACAGTHGQRHGLLRQSDGRERPDPLAAGDGSVLCWFESSRRCRRCWADARPDEG
jgi:hypothetical protein